MQKKPKQEIDNFISGGNDHQYVPEDVTSTDKSPPTETYTHTVPSTYTSLDIEPDELMVRTTCYLTKIQSDYIKKMSKKHKCKESAIIRKAVELLMKG